MSTLADVCKVLGLFNAQNINPGFLTQLSSLLMLKETWCLPWSNPGTSDPDATQPHRRTQLLALWAGPAGSEQQRGWAIEAILDAVEKYSVYAITAPSALARGARSGTVSATWQGLLGSTAPGTSGTRSRPARFASSRFCPSSTRPSSRSARSSSSSPSGRTCAATTRTRSPRRTSPSTTR